MELTKELIEAQGLSEDQAKAISTFNNEQLANAIADTKKEYDGKANEQAEGILTGAAKRITELTNVERTQGEKIADFVDRAWSEFSTEGKTSLEQAKSEYEEKLKNFKGDPEVSKELLSLKDKLDTLQKKEADYDALLGSGVQDKYTELQGKYGTMQKEIAFSNVKPNFSQDANEYEVAAKWDDFKRGVLENYNIVLVEGEAIAVDKENEHKTIKLKDLVEKNEVLTELAKGRQQQGIPAQQTDLKDVDGVPFKIPANADGVELTKAVQDYLLTQKVDKLSPDYSKKFSELYNKAKAGMQETA